MPNTLIHLGVQSLVSKAIFPKIDIRLVFLSCVIPDFPWIIQRAIHAIDPDIDRIDLFLRSNVQASLIFSLIFCFAISTLAFRRRLSFLILASGCIFHLLLDATQIKWGHGILLFAPFNWDLLSFSWLWPEHNIFTLLSFLSLFFVFWSWHRLHFTPLLAPLRIKRLSAAIVALLIYFLAPGFFTESLHQSNSLQTQTIANLKAHSGQEILLDRTPLVQLENGNTSVRLENGNKIQLSGIIKETTGLVSIRGIIIDQHRINVVEIHAHPPFLRIFWSLLGLCLTLMIFIHSFKKGIFEKT